VIATADAMIKAANLCTAFFPTGTGGSNLQRTSSQKDPLPRAVGVPALLPHEVDKSVRECAAQDSAEEVCRFQEKADQVPTLYEGVEVKLRFPISGELRYSSQGSSCHDRLDDFEPFEFRVAECERLALASVLIGGAELFRLGPCRR
jgi:hypothetical protein